MAPQFSRILEPALRQALKESPVVFIAGPRQAGKSTLARQLRPGWAQAPYLTLDDYLNLDQAQHAPDALLDANPGPVVIDEIQRAPQLGLGIKRRVDEARALHHKHAHGMYLLTGSASLGTLPKLSDSLVGRMRLLTLLPLSATEALGGSAAFWPALEKGAQALAALKPSPIPWAEAARQATFPELAASPKLDRRSWFHSYLGTLIQRDALEMSAIEKAPSLNRMLALIAARSGQLLNETSLAADSGLPVTTAIRYRAMLQSLFLVNTLPSWQRNLGKRLIKAPKLYLADPAMQCHLTGLEATGAQSLEASLIGPWVETFVASELRKHLSFHADPAGLFYFRTTDGKEVDFVVEWPNGQAAGIEVKAKKTLDASDLRGLEAFRALAGPSFKCGIIFYLGKEVRALGPSTLALPLSVLWS
jgi:predicted AAA+ superfamily ATPase